MSYDAQENVILKIQSDSTLPFGYEIGGESVGAEKTWQWRDGVKALTDSANIVGGGGLVGPAESASAFIPSRPRYVCPARTEV